MAELSFDRAQRQLAAEVAHWRAAAHSIGELDSIAAPAAWAALERYLDVQVRDQLRSIAGGLAREADQLAASAAGARTADDLALVRPRMLELRRRYLKAETVIEFYCDAVNTRTTPRLGRLLRGLDSVAVQAMDVILRPLGIDAPPVLTYLDRGLGASILRAGVRLWDSGALSPAAAIKITRHNLLRPTSLIHEVGHQVAHLAGWSTELAGALGRALEPRSAVAAAAWESYASEVAADVVAFVHVGCSPLFALANVVDGSREQVFATPIGDPHPFAWLRVLFNAELCRAWFGSGPWDDLAAAWAHRNRVEDADPVPRRIAEASVPHLGLIADVCTRQPMRSFGGRTLASLADPRRASPTELAALARRAGSSLYTSTFLQRHEPLRVLAWNTYQAAVEPERSPELAAQLGSWLERIGTEPMASTA